MKAIRLGILLPIKFHCWLISRGIHSGSWVEEGTKMFQDMFRNMQSDNQSFELLMLIRDQFSFVVK